MEHDPVLLFKDYVKLSIGLLHSNTSVLIHCCTFIIIVFLKGVEDVKERLGAQIGTLRNGKGKRNPHSQSPHPMSENSVLENSHEWSN